MHSFHYKVSYHNIINYIGEYSTSRTKLYLLVFRNFRVSGLNSMYDVYHNGIKPSCMWDLVKVVSRTIRKYKFIYSCFGIRITQTTGLYIRNSNYQNPNQKRFEVFYPNPCGNQIFFVTLHRQNR